MLSKHIYSIHFAKRHPFPVEVKFISNIIEPECKIKIGNQIQTFFRTYEVDTRRCLNLLINKLLLEGFIVTLDIVLDKKQWNYEGIFIGDYSINVTIWDRLSDFILRVTQLLNKLTGKDLDWIDVVQGGKQCQTYIQNKRNIPFAKDLYLLSKYEGYDLYQKIYGTNWKLACIS